MRDHPIIEEMERKGFIGKEEEELEPEKELPFDVNGDRVDPDMEDVIYHEGDIIKEEDWEDYKRVNNL